MITEHQLLREECLLHFYTMGEEHEKVILFIHGASMNHESFKEQMYFFADKGYQVIAVDLRGHGKSKPIGQNYNVNILADDIYAILESLALDKVSIVGHSFGGYVAQALLHNYPEKVNTISLLGTTDLSDIGGAFYKMISKIMPKLLKKMSLESFREQTLAELALKDSVKEYAKKAMEPIKKDEFEKIIIAGVECLYLDCGINSNYHISVPFLLMHGDCDNANKNIFPKSAKKWIQKEKGCEYVVIPKAGHTAHMDNVDEFNLILLNFLDKYNNNK